MLQLLHIKFYLELKGMDNHLTQFSEYFGQSKRLLKRRSWLFLRNQ